MPARRISARVAWQDIAGQGVLLDLTSGEAVGLNAVGTLVWKLLGTAEEEEVVAAVVREFDVDAATATRDLRGFLRLLEEKGLLEPPA